MRKVYLAALKTFFHQRLTETRASRQMTQAQMAQQLEMDERSYVYLDHGQSSCSALTLALFLLYCCSDPLVFLRDLQLAFEEASDHAA